MINSHLTNTKTRKIKYFLSPLNKWLHLSVIAFHVILLSFSNLPTIAQEPGTAADPLVSKSYLDQMFRFRPMVIPAGEKLTLGVGELLVLRSGRLKLRAPKGKALVDLTTGEEIAPDTFIPANHLILVPDSASYVLEAQSLTLILGKGIGTGK